VMFKWFSNFSLKAKLNLGIMGLVIAVELFVLFLNVNSLRNLKSNNVESKSKMILNLVADLAEVPMGEYDLAQLAQIIEQVRLDPEVSYARFVSPEGKVLLHNGQPGAEALSSTGYNLEIHSKSRGGVVVGKFEMGYSGQAEQSALRRLILQSVIEFSVLLIVIFIGVQFAVRRLVDQPLRHLTTAAKAVSSGAREVRVPKLLQLEFSVVASAFNEMLDKISENQAQLESTVLERTEELRETNVELGKKMRETQAAQMQLVHSARLAALGEMSSNIAHEINNPLAVVQGTAQLLNRSLTKTDTVDRAKVVDGLTKIEGMTKRIQKIILGMRTFSRKGDGEALTSVSVQALISDAVALIENRVQSQGIDLQIPLAPEILVECRPTELTQVLVNLVMNAADAIEELQKRDRSRASGNWIRIEPLCDGALLQLQISDSGVGISQELATRIMEPFFTTKDVGKGTGLGLSISKGIIESHQGRLFLRNGTSHTQFVIEIPLQRTAA